MMLLIVGLFVLLLVVFGLYTYTNRKKPATPETDPETDASASTDASAPASAPASAGEDEAGASAGAEAYSATDNSEDLMLNTRDPVGWSVEDHSLLSNNQSGRMLVPRRPCITRC